jgi:hypothetical protein
LWAFLKLVTYVSLKIIQKIEGAIFFYFSYSLRLDKAPTKKQKITLPLFLKKDEIHESQKTRTTPQPMWDKGFGRISSCDSSFFEKIQKMPETRAV